MAIATKVRSRLCEAEENGRLIRVTRTIRRADRLDGFVVGAAKKWFLLHVLDPGMFLNGYTALRVADVKQVTEYADDSFPARALGVRDERRDVPDAIDLTSTKSLLSSAGSLFRLVAVHDEEDDPTI